MLNSLVMSALRTVVRTSLLDLRRISKERGREFDENKHTALCAECGAALSFLGQQGSGGPILVFGVMHWQDCLADEDQIRFRELD